MDKITKFNDIPQFVSSGRYQVDYTVVSLVKFISEEIEEAGLILNPEFQRGHVWTEKQQTAWLEYHLKGGRSGNIIYLNDPNWRTGRPMPGTYVCIDGLQRITACQKFVNNEIKIFGSYFREYTDNIRTLPATVSVNVNDLQTYKEVLQWYIDMNSGGTPHSETEIQRVKDILNDL